MNSIKHIVSVMILCGVVASVKAQAEDHVPWTLRDHYTFSAPNSSLSFDVQRAEWKFEVEGLGSLLREVQAEVQLADGTVLLLSELIPKEDTRDAIDGPMGSATRFRTIFEAVAGLEVSSSITSFKDHAFLILQIEAKNVGHKPIAIEAIRPAVVHPLAPGETPWRSDVTKVPTFNRGHFSVPHDGAHVSLLQFDLKKTDLSFGFGILETGTMHSEINLENNGRGWEGNIECTFDPVLEVQPRKSIESDPVWISYGALEESAIQPYFTWTLSMIPGARKVLNFPDSWITVDADLSTEELFKVARKWSNTSVRHVLAPQAQSSTMPRTQKETKQFVQEVIRLGMSPGVNHDILRASKQKDSWCVTADDGTYWLDLSMAKARSFAQAQIKQLVASGVRFIVVPPSTIPDDVLESLNITRRESDTRAFAVAVEASEGVPVIPSPDLDVANDTAQWQTAVESTSLLAEYGLASGPVRLDVSALTDWNKTLSDALMEYAGPVEFVGEPSSSVRKAIGKVLTAKAEAEKLLTANAGQ